MADPAQEAYIQQQLKALDQESRDPQRFGHSPNFAPIHEERAGKFGRIWDRARGDAITAGIAGAGIGAIFGGGPVGALGLGATSALSAGAVGAGMQAWNEFAPDTLGLPKIPEEVQPLIGAVAGLPGAGAVKVATEFGRHAPTVANWLWQHRNLGWPIAGTLAGPLAWGIANRDYMPNVNHIGASVAGAVLGLGAIGAAAMGKPGLWRGVPIATGIPSVREPITKYAEPALTPVANKLGVPPKEKGGTRLEVDPSVPAGRMDPNTGQPFGQPIPLD